MPKLSNEKSRSIQTGRIHGVHRSKLPLKKIRIDLLGPFPKATTNARYIIVALTI